MKLDLCAVLQCCFSYCSILAAGEGFTTWWWVRWSLECFQVKKNSSTGNTPSHTSLWLSRLTTPFRKQPFPIWHQSKQSFRKFGPSLARKYMGTVTHVKNHWSMWANCRVHTLHWARMWIFHTQSHMNLRMCVRTLICKRDIEVLWKVYAVSCVGGLKSSALCDMLVPELLCRPQSSPPPIAADEVGLCLETFAPKVWKRSDLKDSNIRPLILSWMLQSPQWHRTTGLNTCVMSSVMIDSDLVVIVQAQLEQAALGWRSLIASE